MAPDPAGDDDKRVAEHDDNRDTISPVEQAEVHAGHRHRRQERWRKGETVRNVSLCPGLSLCGPGS